MRIVFVGAGNVATHLAKKLYVEGCTISQIWSHSLENAKHLAQQLGNDVDYTDNLDDVDKTADVYVFSVVDAALEPILTEYALCFNKQAVFVHTAGSVSINIFKPFALNYGVLYPLQTFSKEKVVDFSTVSLFVEANSKHTEQIITDLAKHLSDKIYFTNSEGRQKLHLAAVFACNFSNHMYEIGRELIQQANLPFDVLLPLIMETADKIQRLSPFDAQTGPAVRNDCNTMEKHLNMLNKKPDWQGIYRIISDDIRKSHDK